MAILWYGKPVNEISMNGLKFDHLEEWKVVLPFFIAYGLFLIRYLQGWIQMRNQFRAGFISYINQLLKVEMVRSKISIEVDGFGVRSKDSEELSMTGGI